MDLTKFVALGAFYGVNKNASQFLVPGQRVQFQRLCKISFALLIFAIDVMLCSVGYSDWECGDGRLPLHCCWGTIGEFESYISSLGPDYYGPYTLSLIEWDTGSYGNFIVVKVNNFRIDGFQTNPMLDPAFRSIPGVQQNGKMCGDPGCQCAGDPITASTGNLFEQVEDYSTAGANPLSFTRYYNSEADTSSAAVSLGVNWRSTFDRYLRLITSGGQPIGITAEREDGKEFIFNPNPNGPNWTSDADVDIVIAQTASGWVLTNHNDIVETYNSGSGGTALLTSIQERNGYTQSLQYNANNQLMAVTDSFGRSLEFTYQYSETNLLLEGPVLATNLVPNLLQTVTTPSGLVLTYNFGSSGKTPGVLDRLASVSYSTAPPTSKQYVYENSSYPFALTGMIDEDGNRFASWTYTSFGYANSSQHGNGADLTTITYNPDSSTSVTNALGQVMVYKFAYVFGQLKTVEIDRLASATVPAATMTYGYDSNGFIATNSDWNTRVTGSVNDIHGQPLILNEAVGTAQARTTTNSFLTNYHLPMQIMAPRKTSNFIYDTNGNMLVLTETDTSTNNVPYSTTGNARSWTNTFDNLGHLLTTTGPRTDVTATTSFTYDASNNISSVTDALGHETQFTNYTGSGLPQTMIDANGVTTEFTYNARDWLLTRAVLAASGNATNTFGYDAAGNVTSITLPDGELLNYQYDAAHRLQSVTNLLGESINYLLDANGDITNQTISNAGGMVVTTQIAVFDQLGRMLSQIGAYSETTSFGYDADGNQLSITDAKTNATMRAFDALNRLVDTIDPLTNSTGLGYDPQDNLLSVTDPRSLVTSYIYDGFRHVIQETSPDKGVTVYILDKAGNRTNELDARNVVTQRTFDKLNRVTTETFPASPGENITFTYDATNGGNFGVGHLTGYTDETGSTALVYNERGDMVSTTRTIGSHAYTTGYMYDLADHIMGITYPSGDGVTYTRDTQGRIASVVLHPAVGAPAFLATNVTYMPFGPLAGLVYGNGLSRSQIYDEDYRLTGISTTGNSASIQNLALGFDVVNDIIAITNSLATGKTQAFGYDPDYRLTNAAGVYGTLGYSYDADGNRLTSTAGNVTQTYNYSVTANQLQSTVQAGVTRNFSYTLNGNLNSDNRGSSTSLVFGYGNCNRYNTLTTGGNPTASYQYNALGERLVKTVGSVTTHYHYDQRGHLIAESQPNGTVIREYVWLDDMPLAQIEAGGAVYFIHPDHLNTPQKLTDTAQNVVWDREQQPFGQNASLTYPALFPPLTSLFYDAQHDFHFTVSGGTNYTYVVGASDSLSSPNWQTLATESGTFAFTDLNAPFHPIRFYQVSSTASPITENLRFPGQYYDAESGLNYNMMRDYDPTLGRYIQNDPIGLWGGINLFAYVTGNSISKFDVFGFFDENISDVLGDNVMYGRSGPPVQPWTYSQMKEASENLGSLAAGAALAGIEPVAVTAGILSAGLGSAATLGQNNPSSAAMDLAKTSIAHLLHVDKAVDLMTPILKHMLCKMKTPPLPPIDNMNPPNTWPGDRPPLFILPRGTGTPIL